MTTISGVQGEESAKYFTHKSNLYSKISTAKGPLFTFKRSFNLFLTELTKLDMCAAKGRWNSTTSMRTYKKGEVSTS